MPKRDSDLVLCHQCNRGGNGNDKDKCACGWRISSPSNHGCFLGSAIVGAIKQKEKLSRSKMRYMRFLEYGDGFGSFIKYCRWDAAPERSWNIKSQHEHAVQR